MISFSISSNDNVRNFLNGNDTAIPVSEYMYLHTRPLIRPSFLTEIDDLTIAAGTRLEKHNVKSGMYIDSLTQIAINLGSQLDGDMTEEKARSILFSLRDLYNRCNEILKKLP